MPPPEVSSKLVLLIFLRAGAIAAVAFLFTFVLFKVAETANPYAFEGFYGIRLLEGIMMCLGAVAYEASRERLHHARSIRRSSVVSVAYGKAGVLLLIAGFASSGLL